MKDEKKYMLNNHWNKELMRRLEAKSKKCVGRTLYTMMRSLEFILTMWEIFGGFKGWVFNHGFFNHGFFNHEVFNHGLPRWR